MYHVCYSQINDIQKFKPFVELQKGNYNNAIEGFSLLISDNPEKDILLARLEAYYMKGDYENALNECIQVEKVEKGIASEYLVKIYLQKNDIHKAEQKLLENLKSSYKIPMFKLLNHSDFSQLHDSFFLDSILKTNSYSSTDKQLFKVEKLIHSENYSDALFLANEIANRNPNVAQAYYFLSKINSHNNQLNDAKYYIDKALELKTSKIEYLNTRIEINIKLENFTEASVDIEKAIKLNPYILDLYLTKANILLNLQEYDKAIEQGNFYLALYPNNSDALFVHAKSYFKKGENFEALKFINESLNTKKSIKQYELRGDIYTETGTYQFAEMDYSMALDLNANEGDIWAKKGFARFKSGNKKGACSDWEKGKRYGSLLAIEYLEKYCK
ncbi:MAG: hypothetical protein A2041_10170 [Bacteroidetes bacterium GWA2_31_9b]|nr:MAG: hypothetical protein A2041_10170 [Bacteroidetes bacterium GWA2_31_9b]